MSRNTVALASPSRNVRTRPGCSSTYQRPSGPWNAPVIELNVSPPIARTSRTCGIVVATVGTGVGAGVGDGLAVGDGVGDGDGLAVGDGVDGAAVGDDDAPIVGVGTVTVADGEQAHTIARVAATASRRAPMTVTLATRSRVWRYAIQLGIPGNGRRANPRQMGNGRPARHLQCHAEHLDRPPARPARSHSRGAW